MDGEQLIKDIYENLSGGYGGSSMRTEMKTAMADILESEGYIVCESEADFREKALAETDLVEPNDE